MGVVGHGAILPEGARRQIDGAIGRQRATSVNVGCVRRCGASTSLVRTIGIEKQLNPLRLDIH
jgi:hypothetical protein